jgi:hypothetical protein
MTVKKPKTYRRSTPVSRLHRNVAKIQRLAGIIRTRLGGWVISDERLVRAWSLVSQVAFASDELGQIMDELEAEKFVPPAKSAVVVFEEKQAVRIVPKHRAKYELAFASLLANDPEMLDNLTVVSILPMGDIVVRSGQKAPFMVPKTHLAPASLDEDPRKRGK